MINVPTVVVPNKATKESSQRTIMFLCECASAILACDASCGINSTGPTTVTEAAVCDDSTAANLQETGGSNEKDPLNMSKLADSVRQLYSQMEQILVNAEKQGVEAQQSTDVQQFRACVTMSYMMGGARLQDLMAVRSSVTPDLADTAQRQVNNVQDVLSQYLAGRSKATASISKETTSLEVSFTDAVEPTKLIDGVLCDVHDEPIQSESQTADSVSFLQRAFKFIGKCMPFRR